MRGAALRTRYVVAAGMCGVAIVAVVVLALILSNNVVYYRTVSEALERRDTDRSRFRLAGVVVDDSVVETRDGVAFDVTDGKIVAHVVAHGDPPDLFKDGAPILAEGKWEGSTFETNRLMIKHGSTYKPPSVTTTTSPNRQAPSQERARP